MRTSGPRDYAPNRLFAASPDRTFSSSSALPSRARIWCDRRRSTAAASPDGTTCQETPYLSFSQPQAAFNTAIAKSAPEAIDLFLGVAGTWNEIASLNL